MKSIIGVIPARYASSRFPGKPLADLGGKTMIQRVYEQVNKVKSLSGVYVATDDERIFKEVEKFGGKALMTKANHVSGTDRCFEAASSIAEKPDVVINIQGDEPFIHVSQIEELVSIMANNAEIGTLVKKIDDEDTLLDINTPKVVFDSNYEALYFSRESIPHIRSVHKKEWLTHHTFYKHIGVYGYRYDVLEKLCQLQPSSLEKAESLEQLRWLENGFKIKIGITDAESFGIDTPEQLKEAQKRLSL